MKLRDIVVYFDKLVEITLNADKQAGEKRFLVTALQYSMKKMPAKTSFTNLFKELLKWMF